MLKLIPRPLRLPKQLIPRLLGRGGGVPSRAVSGRAAGGTRAAPGTWGANSARTCPSMSNARSVHTVVFLRHGESLWNVEKRYTGWCDVPLTKSGELDALDAGRLMKERGLHFDIAFTSNLQRAWRSCELALEGAGETHVPTIKSWRLNERHYGLLQGYSKDCEHLRSLFGEKQLVSWRRSYTDTPPSLNDSQLLQKVRHCTMSHCTDPSSSAPYGNDINASLVKSGDPLNTALSVASDALPGPGHLDHHPVRSMSEAAIKHMELPFIEHCPSAESLKACEIRAYGYWRDVISPHIRKGKRVLIVAHANTIRSLVKVLDGIPDDNIQHLRIPNGVPLVYALDANLRPTEQFTDDLGFQANYLVSPHNHTKMMLYERCFVRKLRSLFQYFDKDGDGRVSVQSMQEGLLKLKAYQKEATGSAAKLKKKVAKVSVGDASSSGVGAGAATGEKEAEEDDGDFFWDEEELLRSFPKPEEGGSFTLESFLRYEEQLRPALSKLRLLQ